MEPVERVMCEPGWRARGGAALLIACVLVSCRQPEEAPPVAPDLMTDLLVDLHLAHARVDVGAIDSTAYVDSLLRRHGVSEEEFRTAMQYYADRPELYVSLLDSVIDRMRVSRPSADAGAGDPLYARPYGSVFRDTLADLDR